MYSSSQAESNQAKESAWSRLPAEIKMKIFSHAGIVILRPVQPTTAPIHTIRLLTDGMGRVDRESNILATDAFYKENIFVAEFCRSYNGGRTFQTPPPAYGHLVRRLEVHLRIELTPLSIQKLLDRESDWRYLLALDEGAGELRSWRLRDQSPGPLHRGGVDLGWHPSVTDWQDGFPNLDTLKIVLICNEIIRGLEGLKDCRKCLVSLWRPKRDRNEEGQNHFVGVVKELLMGTRIKIGAKKVDVKVQGMTDCNQHYLCTGSCAEDLRTAILDMVPVRNDN
ncbi:hypothetical protein CC80DRAFT_555798 [Byssothecium circinans]|uniref:Uncharacterized protein n=1 Tax=Byssothecium circinans TaxID=147558 RepID=A0A6A5T9N9_9PLEO|nr:hypothetical protein CC80DRAFT_555798 [Byssothecium circinans]